MRRLTATLALAAACAWPAAAHAYFEEIAVDSRLLAMGSSGQAEARGVSAYYWNPAGLARLKGWEFMADYARPYGTPDLAANALIVGGRWNEVPFAAGWHRLGIADVYAEDLFIVAAGRELVALPSGHRLAAGATLKFGRVSIQKFSVGPPGMSVDYDYGARSALSADLGLIWSTPWKLSLAWVSRDPLKPDFTFGDVEDAGQVPARQEVGLAYAWNTESTLLASWSETDGSGRTRLSLGLEVTFYNVFAIRSGISNISEITRGDDPGVSNDEFRYVGGFGITHRGWNIDAAAETHHELGASYRATLTRAWGGGPR